VRQVELLNRLIFLICNVIIFHWKKSHFSECFIKKSLSELNYIKWQKLN
jgi:hypothetical protein